MRHGVISTRQDEGSASGQGPQSTRGGNCEGPLVGANFSDQGRTVQTPSRPDQCQGNNVKADDIRQDWTQDGTFADSDGIRVRCYDDVALLKDTDSEPDSNGFVITLPAGTSGTVLFFTTGEPCWLEIEYETNGMVFGVVEASHTKLHLRNEEKYPR